MSAVRLRPRLRVMWKVHRFLLRASRGRFASRLGIVKVLLLETTGNKSGHPRSVGLSHLEQDDRYFVVASHAPEGS